MLQCPVPHNVTWDGLCYGSGTTMFMNGFTSIASEERGSTECVNFLFIDWTLDSTVKYVFACIGTLLLGIATQGVGHARITLGKLRRNNYMKLQILVFYGVQMCLSYFLMLLAMTYSTELFCMVIVGLTIGYWMFHLNSNSDASENVEPCCAGNDGDYLLHDKINDLNTSLIGNNGLLDGGSVSMH